MINDEKTEIPVFTLSEVRRKRHDSFASGFSVACLFCAGVYNIARALGWTS